MGERIDGDSSWFAFNGPNIWAAWSNLGLLSVEENGPRRGGNPNLVSSVLLSLSAASIIAHAGDSQERPLP